jgi:hypothetical protein
MLALTAWMPIAKIRLQEYLNAKIALDHVRHSKNATITKLLIVLAICAQAFLFTTAIIL